ncbi:MAG: glycoside hydrolase family 13 protein [Gammaproteobacteria bacterium]|nr:glycoside hydrolase family 13 protein [Gammaproteobacteria bacterium]MDH3415156.1 glycoside hydrolase family 13 protein [Gammaproteobacteria bacterium]
MRHRIATALLILTIVTPVFAGPIDRVEPPFWWQGFEHNELQIMIHGHGIAAFDVSIDHPGVTLDRVEKVESDNYLFLYINIDDSAKAGTFDILLENDNFRVKHKYELKSKNPDPAYTQGFSPADTIYLITPDRFANGDPSNDTIAGFDDALNRDDDYGRHGGDLAGIEQHLDYIEDMGFTAIWLNPILENAMQNSSYHGYSTTDYYRVDPRFGSNADYRDFVGAARQQGIGVIMDMIVNHIGSEHWWMDDLPAPDWLNQPDKRTVSTHAATTHQDPYASDYDKAAHTDGWFVDTMPDLNQRNPLLADYLTQNAIWWIEYVGLSGIRQDTHSYPDKHYMAEWSRRIMQEFPQFNLTGEDTSENPAVIAYWQNGKVNSDGFKSYMPSMLDFPLRNAVLNSLTEEAPWWSSPWSTVYNLLAGDFVYPDPWNLVTFVDNHDRLRVFTWLEKDYDLFRMAMVFCATMRGIPQIYYGTEIVMDSPRPKHDGVIRTEFPGGWPDHDKNAFTGHGLTAEERRAQTFMRKLLTWRKNKTVIHTGKLMQFTPITNVYAYFRYADHETVMVVFNRGEESVSLDMERFEERLRDSKYAEDVLSGKRFNIESEIKLEPMSVMILEIE